MKIVILFVLILYRIEAKCPEMDECDKPQITSFTNRFLGQSEASVKICGTSWICGPSSECCVDACGGPVCIKASGLKNDDVIIDVDCPISDHCGLSSVDCSECELCCSDKCGQFYCHPKIAQAEKTDPFEILFQGGNQFNAIAQGFNPLANESGETGALAANVLGQQQHQFEASQQLLSQDGSLMNADIVQHLNPQSSPIDQIQEAIAPVSAQNQDADPPQEQETPISEDNSEPGSVVPNDASNPQLIADQSAQMASSINENPVATSLEEHSPEAQAENVQEFVSGQNNGDIESESGIGAQIPVEVSDQQQFVQAQAGGESSPLEGSQMTAETAGNTKSRLASLFTSKQSDNS